jgi:hypothetical protein
MRTASLTTMTLLACGLAFAGRIENAVYTGGDLDGIAPQSNVVVDLSGDNVLKVRAAQTDFSVPYATVTKAGVAATDDAPPAKSKFSFHKSAKPAQTLTVEFQSVKGEAKSMTLQLSQPAANSVLAAVRKHSPVVQVPVKEKRAKVAKKDKSADQTAEKKDEKASGDKTEDPHEIAKNNPGTKAVSNADGSWWGDDVWKTTRNQARWEQQSAPAAQ